MLIFTALVNIMTIDIRPNFRSNHLPTSQKVYLLVENLEQFRDFRFGHLKFSAYPYHELNLLMENFVETSLYTGRLPSHFLHYLVLVSTASKICDENRHGNNKLTLWSQHYQQAMTSDPVCHFSSFAFGLSVGYFIISRPLHVSTPGCWSS